MRSLRLLAGFAAALAVTAVVVRLSGEAASPPTDGTVDLIGDSLNVGVEPYLPDVLPRWSVVARDRVGRTTPEGVEELRAGRAELAPYLVVSLGTNDPPSGVATFRANVARILRIAGPERCVVWATIWRDGKPSEAFNEVLRDAAEENRRVRLVDWAGMVKQHPEWLAPDGLHGSEAGYRERAEAVGRAVESCVPGVTAPAR